jgi:hypothetical protein
VRGHRTEAGRDQWDPSLFPSITALNILPAMA